jgi:2-aminoethylphosphonate-pyruvate transaminase
MPGKTKQQKKMILLNPGPVTLSKRVRAALTRGDWCHREPEFAVLTREINAELVAVYPEMAGAFDAVMLTGSGTSAVEAMLASFAPDHGGTLVLANGVYGERMSRMLAVHRKPHQLMQNPWIAPLDMTAVSDLLDQHPEITHLATVHHETTTGRLNDLHALGGLCRERELSLLLDAVSSFGAEDIDAEGWNLDAMAGTANKCLHGVPGLSFVIARKPLWTRSSPQVGSIYLDLYAYYASQHGEGYSPFTQSVQVAFALREALAELRQAGGWQTRQAIYRQRAEVIYEELTSINIDILLKKNDYSCVLMSYRLPAGISYAELHDGLKEAGFVIYAGQGELAQSVFRIAHMGEIDTQDLEALCIALRTALGSRA